MYKTYVPETVYTCNTYKRESDTERKNKKITTETTRIQLFFYLQIYVKF